MVIAILSRLKCFGKCCVFVKLVFESIYMICSLSGAFLMNMWKTKKMLVIILVANTKKVWCNLEGSSSIKKAYGI